MYFDVFVYLHFRVFLSIVSIMLLIEVYNQLENKPNKLD